GSTESRSLVVSNTNDSGAGSLRQAILDANSLAGADTVTFDPAVFATPQTIKLTTGEIAINDAVAIVGPVGKGTIEGSLARRVFTRSGAPAGAAVVWQGLTLTNGKRANQGGAINTTDEAIPLQNCAFTNNTATNGGAVALGLPSASLLVEDSVISGN